MMMLDMNKQLDLQTPFVAFVQELVLGESWGNHRRAMKVGIVVTVGLLSVTLLTCTRFLFLRQSHPETCLAFVGLVMAVGFVMARVSSFQMNNLHSLVSVYP